MSTSEDLTPSGLPVAFMGDTHGNTIWVEKVIRLAAQHDTYTVISLGDFGVWSGPGGAKVLEKVNKTCVYYGVDLLVVDGNHDCHPALTKAKRDAAGRGLLRDRIRHLPRGYRFMLGGVSFAALGGAVSIDQNMRTENVDWWRQEQISNDDAARTIAGGGVDVLLAHDCPTGVDLRLPTSVAPWFTPDVQLQAAQHRDLLRHVTDALAPRVLLHGHYHKQVNATLTATGATGGQYTTRIIGLSQEWTATNLMLTRVSPGIEPVTNRWFPVPHFE